MTLSSVLELDHLIVSFIQPVDDTEKEIKSCARRLVALSLADRQLIPICSEKLATLFNIITFSAEMYNKYNRHNSQYQELLSGHASHPDEPWSITHPNIKFDPDAKPYLLDALSTGCNYPLAKRTFNEYTPEVEQDVQNMISLTPRSMNCILGEFRITKFISPLAIACFNPNIPVHIIERLLQQRANPNTIVLDYYRSCSIPPLIHHYRNSEQVTAITELFTQYGWSGWIQQESSSSDEDETGDALKSV